MSIPPDRVHGGDVGLMASGSHPTLLQVVALIGRNSSSVVRGDGPLDPAMVEALHKVTARLALDEPMRCRASLPNRATWTGSASITPEGD